MIDPFIFNRHEKVALLASGGKDSLACVYLLRPYLDRITVYNIDTGDLLPEVREIVDHIEAMVPHFVRVVGNVDQWIADNGLPTDLMPHSSDDVGRKMGEYRTALVPRYECCYSNLMAPLFARVIADGNTLIIRGTKRVDMNRLPMDDGDVGDGVELMLPIADWSHEQVFAYLREVGAPISRVYDHVTNSPECARCSAWWGEKRAEYLRKFHPELFEDYARRLRLVWGELEQPLRSLHVELQGIA